MEKNPLKPLPKVSTEAIIDTLRLMRDKQIQELLKSDDTLMKFLDKQYNTITLSLIKKEFLKRDLLELKRSSLDLVHYSSLIKEVKENGGVGLTGAHQFFVQELDGICRKYA